MKEMTFKEIWNAGGWVVAAIVGIFVVLVIVGIIFPPH
jgi:hypothetical protein